MKHALPLLTTLLLAPLAALHAAEPVTIDLAKRTWQGIPGLERTANGRVFVSWFTGGTKEPEPENTVVLSHSDDDGKTVSEPQAMALPLSGGTRCYDPCLWIDPKGRLWYLFNRSVKDSTRHGVYARICDAPDASPPVWGAEFRVGFDRPFSFRMNKPTVLSAGEWVLPVVHALEPLAGWAGFDPKQVFGAAISTDEGRTWKLHGEVKTTKAGLENMIVELKDGRLWMLIRTEKVLWESHSSDKGRTWTPGRPTTIATPHSRFFIRRLASGNLLLVNHYKFTGRSHLTAQLSTDDGATWNDGLLLDERKGVSYPDGVQDKDGLIWITYDRDRGGAGEILLAKFKEEDVVAGKNVSGAVSLQQVVNKLNKPSLLPANWDPALAGGIVLQRLVKVTAPKVKGAHDAEFVCVGERAYIVASANDVQQGENPEWPFMYVTMSIVNLKSLKLEKAIDFAESEQAFENQTLPAGACIVPRIIRKDDGTLRCYFDSNNPGKRQSQVWYRDFDLKRGEFAPTLHKAKLKTAAGTFDFQPQYLHADAAAQGFTRVATDSTIHIFDSFKRIDGRIYVALNNFRGKQNALALVHDDLETFEVLGHFNQPESAALSESVVNRLPDGTWMAVVRSDIPVRDGGNYHFATSRDGRTWTAGRPMPHVPNGLGSKPTFDRFGDIYYLGWQESTRIKDASDRFVDRSVFNVDVSRDGRTWERKYRFEAPESFQYPTFHEHNGAVWLTVTQGDEPPHRKARIMFGKLEDVGRFESEARKTRKPLPSPTELPASIRPDPKWTSQAAKDAKQDFTSIPFDGTTPNKLACDTTLRELPDGSWVMAMLGGGDTEPLPENHVLLTRSHDKGKTWSPMQPLDFGFPREGDTIAMVPSELMVRAERCTLFFATHDGTFAGWKEWMTHSEDSCLTWSKPAPAPGRLHDRTFIRNHILTKDGRILLPFQHYKRVKETKTIAGGRRLSEPTDSRNGVLMSADGGKTWTEHGDIRISKDDTYYGWAENNIVELADGRIAMIIRADGLGGALYYAESNDGGKTWPEFAVKSDIPNPGSKATLYPLGGDTVALLHNPNPKGRHPLALWISFDGMKTWPYQRVLVEHSSDGPGRSLNYPDGFVSQDKQWLHFAYDDNRHRAVHYSAKLPPLPAPKAADAPKPAVKVTQELLNSIHVTPKLIFDPMPAYGQKYLPFAMAASMESTSKGRLWTCWAGGQDGPNAYLLASYSDDQGKSWRDPVFAIDPQAHGLKMGTRLGSFWCDPKGRLWLFFHQSVGMFDGSCSNWFVRCDDPDAEKPVWTEPVYIGFGASLNKPIVRKNGEWILPVSLWERWHIDKPFADCYHELDAVRGANVFVSDDEGASWRYRGGIIFKDSCFNEHTVVEKQDGTLWMLSRGMKEAFQSFSTDGGRTWQPQTNFFPHVNSKAVFRRLQSGNLLLIRHGAAFDQQPRDGTEEWNWGKGRSHLTAFLSTDDGKTWSGSLLLDERHPVSYPDIAQAPNGDIYVHYDRDRYGAAEILFARFREEDVQAGKLVSKDGALKNLVKSKLAMNHGSSGYKGKNASAAVPVVSPLEAKLAKFREDLPLMLVPPRVREFNDPKLLDGRQHVAYPGIARTTQGRLWVCWGAGEDGAGGYSMITSSDDEGRTWSGPRYILKEAPTPNGFPRSINGTYLWTDPKGRLWWFFPYSLGIFDGRAGIWAAVCEDPDADKLTWGIPRRLADGEYVNKPFILRDSSWLLSATLFPRKCIGVKMGDMKDSDLFTELDSLRMSNFFISKDDGATWERRGGVTAPPDVWDWDEPHFIEKSSGELRTLIRTQYGLCESRSKDGARTWTAPEPSKLLHPNSRIFTMKLQSGKVLLVKHGRLDEKTGRTHLTAYLSDDEGETWRGGLLLEERGCSYPDGIQAPDGRIHIVYDQERHNGRILMATLREEDVRAGKLVSKDTSLKTLVHGAATAPKETKGLPPQD